MLEIKINSDKLQLLNSLTLKEILDFDPRFQIEGLFSKKTLIFDI